MSMWTLFSLVAIGLICIIVGCFIVLFAMVVDLFFDVVVSGFNKRKQKRIEATWRHAKR